MESNALCLDRILCIDINWRAGGLGNSKGKSHLAKKGLSSEGIFPAQEWIDKVFTYSVMEFYVTVILSLKKPF